MNQSSNSPRQTTVAPTRRRFLIASATLPFVARAMTASSTRAADQPPRSRRIPIGFSLYGMKSMTVRDALRECQAVGYDCVELPVMADWPADSRALSPAARQDIRAALSDTSLRLGALMENLNLLAEPAAHAANLDRLKRAVDLARELVPDSPPVIETILGGRPADWPQVRQAMADRLQTWAETIGSSKVVLAIKPHVGGAMHRPEHAVWLLDQVNVPHVRAAYDFSHYQLQGIGLAESLETLLPRSVFIHVKDGRGDAKKFQFMLPGEGAIDYVDYFRRLSAGNYAGDVVVEVSGQIHSRPDYDPRAAARRSFAALAAARKQAE